MAIDHEAHKIRIKAVSDRMNHPMTYNDAGAPRESFVKSNPMPKPIMRGTSDRDKLIGKR
jgi:hypothetical protein